MEFGNKGERDTERQRDRDRPMQTNNSIDNRNSFTVKLQKWNLIVYFFSLFIFITNFSRRRSFSGSFLKFVIYGYYLILLQLELCSSFPSWKKINMNKILENCSFLGSFAGRGISNLIVCMVASSIGMTRGFLGEAALFGNIFFSAWLITQEFRIGSGSDVSKPPSYRLADFMVAEQSTTGHISIEQSQSPSPVTSILHGQEEREREETNRLV